MFYSHELLSLRHKGKLARCWLAASVSDQIFKQMCKSSTVNGINLCDLCDEIMNTIQIKSNEANKRFSLYLSSQLMYGATKILLYQTTSLQNQIFQIDKKALYYEKNKTYELQNSSTDLELCNVTSLVKDYNAQMDYNLHDKFNINNKMDIMMHDATCLDFGALTHEQLNFLHPNDDISLEILDRMHLTNVNLDDELSCAFSNNEKFLTDFESSELSMHKNEMEISISPIHDDMSKDQAHQVNFITGVLPEITMEEVETRPRGMLSEKRQPSEEKHIETPSKRRRLRFEDEPDAEHVATIPILETAVVSTVDYPLEPSQNVKLTESSLNIDKKSQKKKVFADKNTKLSHKTIRRWLKDINAHIMPLNIFNINMPTTDILFKAPSASFTSKHKKKWNNSLSALFHMHTVTKYVQEPMPMEYGELLDKSTEFTRVHDGSNKTAELLSELSSALGKSAEISKNITSEKNITITMDELPKIPKINDLLESITDEPEVAQSPNITEDVFIPNASYDSSKVFPFYSITKRELLVLLEIIWQNTVFAKFSDILSSDHYSKFDASLCFEFLLELHKEKTIILKQALPYDIIWIQKYA